LGVAEGLWALGSGQSKTTAAHARRDALCIVVPAEAGTHLDDGSDGFPPARE